MEEHLSYSSAYEELERIAREMEDETVSIVLAGLTKSIPQQHHERVGELQQLSSVLDSLPL